MVHATSTRSLNEIMDSGLSRTQSLAPEPSFRTYTGRRTGHNRQLVGEGSKVPTADCVCQGS